MAEPRVPKAFSSEVGTGSRQENASNKEVEPPFRFNRNGKGSRPMNLLQPGKQKLNIGISRCAIRHLS
jgi:hypothetical protein